MNVLDNIHLVSVDRQEGTTTSILGQLLDSKDTIMIMDSHQQKRTVQRHIDDHMSDQVWSIQDWVGYPYPHPNFDELHIDTGFYEGDDLMRLFTDLATHDAPAYYYMVAKPSNNDNLPKDTATAQ